MKMPDLILILATVALLVVAVTKIGELLTGEDRRKTFYRGTAGINPNKRNAK
jgi:hypothetical protein